MENKGQEEMKIAILGTTGHWQKKQWRQAAIRLGHKINFIQMKNVVIKIDQKHGVRVYAQGKNRMLDMKKYDAVLRRWIKKYYTQSLLLCWYLKKEGKVIINSKLERIHDKITQALKLRMAGLPHPPTYQALRPKTVKKLLDKVHYPIILKRIEGSLGQQVYLAKSKNAAFKILKDHQMHNVLIQKYFPVREDFRVFVLGNRILGAMKRIAPPGEYRSNVARGAFTQKAVLTPQMKKLALKAAKVMGYEIAGVDILFYKGKPYILEVNRTPQFRGFTKTMGINVAEEILKYLEKLVRKKK